MKTGDNQRLNSLPALKKAASEAAARYQCTRKVDRRSFAGQSAAGDRESAKLRFYCHPLGDRNTGYYADWTPEWRTPVTSAGVFPPITIGGFIEVVLPQWFEPKSDVEIRLDDCVPAIGSVVTKLVQG